MNHEQILRDLQAPSIKLLNSPNAPLVLSFLQQEFKQNLKPSITEEKLLENLELYLERLREHDPKLYPSKASEYLKQWTDEEHRWLRRYRGNNDDYLIELTPHSERALGWLQELQRRGFVGTESRFYQVLSILSDLLRKSSEDIPGRLQQLENEKAAIEAEIERIKTTGQVESYSPSQIRERFQLAQEGAAQLIRDFASVEENFREIAHAVQVAQLQPDARKGAVVGSVLDAEEELRNSEVGRSFYGFWDYLQAPENKDELNNLLDGVFRLPEIIALAGQSALLRHMSNHLIAAGLKVDKSNHRLAEQLRRMLDEANLAENRRVRQLLSEVKQLFLQNQQKLGESFGVELELLPDAQLVMERELWQEPSITVFESQLENEPDLEAIDISSLLEQFYVDEELLLDRIEIALQQDAEISLGELCQTFPIEKGLAEVVAYLSIASKSKRHQVNDAYTEIIHYQAESRDILLEMPEIRFRRHAES
jgi:hypothetical protein